MLALLYASVWYRNTGSPTKTCLVLLALSAITLHPFRMLGKRSKKGYDLFDSDAFRHYSTYFNKYKYPITSDDKKYKRVK